MSIEKLNNGNTVPSAALGPLSAPHPWGGAGRPDGLCPCGEGSDAGIHQSHEEREQVMSEILADWSSVTDTGELNIVRGTE